MIFLYRSDKEEEDQTKADVADEEAERSKRFDEEAGLGSSNRRSTVAESSKSGTSNRKRDSFPTYAAAETSGIGNKSMGKDKSREES